MVAGSGAALLTFDALELELDLQCDRHLGHVLPAFSGALEQPGQLAPGKLEAVLGGQMLFDERLDVGEKGRG